MSASDALHLGITWLQRGRPDRAEEHLRQAVAEDPNDPEGLAYLALALLQRDEDEEALELAETAVGAAPDWSHAQVVRSWALQSLGRVQESERAARQAIELDAEDSDGYSALAGALGGQKRWRESLEAAEAGLAVDPECALCANRRALALIQLGEASAADFALESALRGDPEDPVTHANLGWSALNQGDHERARRHYREALRLDPTSEGARAGLVEALNARNPIYRLFLRWFLLLTRIPQRTVVLIMIGSVFARQILRKVAESNPAAAPFFMPVFWALVAFIALSWIAQPMFNLLLLFDRDGRHALDDVQVRQARWLAACVALALVLLGAFVAGIAGMGLAAAVAAAMIIPVVTAAGSEGHGARLRWGAAIGLALLGGLAVVHGVRFQSWQRRIQPYFERLPEAALTDTEAEQAAVSEWPPADAARYVALRAEAVRYTELGEKSGRYVGVFALGIAAFTWVGGGLVGR